MNCEEWFQKRESLAALFGVNPNEVPPEAVWFLDLTPPTEADMAAGKRVWEEIQRTDNGGKRLTCTCYGGPHGGYTCPGCRA